MLANQIWLTTLSAAIVFRVHPFLAKKHRKLPFLAIALFFYFLLYRHESEGENVSIQYSSSNILYLNILYTNSSSGCGKTEAHNNNWSMVMQRRHPLLELP